MLSSSPVSLVSSVSTALPPDLALESNDFEPKRSPRQPDILRVPVEEDGLRKGSRSLMLSSSPTSLLATSVPSAPKPNRMPELEAFELEQRRVVLSSERPLNDLKLKNPLRLGRLGVPVEADDDLKRGRRLVTLGSSPASKVSTLSLLSDAASSSSEMARVSGATEVGQKFGMHKDMRDPVDTTRLTTPLLDLVDTWQVTSMPGPSSEPEDVCRRRRLVVSSLGPQLLETTKEPLSSS